MTPGFGLHGAAPFDYSAIKGPPDREGLFFHRTISEEASKWRDTKSRRKKKIVLNRGRRRRHRSPRCSLPRHRRRAARHGHLLSAGRAAGSRAAGDRVGGRLRRRRRAREARVRLQGDGIVHRLGAAGRHVGRNRRHLHDQHRSGKRPECRPAASVRRFGVARRNCGGSAYGPAPATRPPRCRR